MDWKKHFEEKLVSDWLAKSENVPADWLMEKIAFEARYTVMWLAPSPPKMSVDFTLKTIEHAIEDIATACDRRLFINHDMRLITVVGGYTD